MEKTISNERANSGEKTTDSERAIHLEKTMQVERARLGEKTRWSEWANMLTGRRRLCGGSVLKTGGRPL